MGVSQPGGLVGFGEFANALKWPKAQNRNRGNGLQGETESTNASFYMTSCYESE